MDSKAIIRRLKEDGWQELHVVGSHHRRKPPQIHAPEKTASCDRHSPKEGFCNRHIEEHLPTSRMGVEVRMLFPVVIHKDEDSCFSVTIPDMPGCFTAGDTMQDAVKNIQEAAECHYFNEADLPVASDLEKWIDDPLYKDGVWVMVDIDVSRLQVKAKRVNITIPENLLSRIDRYASAHHLTRSGLLAQAASRYMSENP